MDKRVRIIPCLDVDNGRVVKGTQFKNLYDAGDPVELAEFYYVNGADEIVFLDIGASCNSRKILIDVVKQVAEKVFVPLTVGGGISSMDDMETLFKAGADKISLCSGAVKDPSILTKGAQRYGNQAIVLSVDAGRVDGSWRVFTHGGRRDSGLDAVKWAVQGVELGAGEILLNSIDMDGTGTGYDIELNRTISEKVSVPVIASGGAGSAEHLWQVINSGKADAVLLASLLHRKETDIVTVKRYLDSKGVLVRW